MWGIHPPIFYIFEIRLVRYLEDPFAKSWVLGRPTVTSNIISRRNVICKNRLFTKKIADFSIFFPVRRCLCRPKPPAGASSLALTKAGQGRQQGHLVDHSFAKNMLLKIGATLATPSILFGYVVVRCLFVGRKHLCASINLKIQYVFMKVRCIRKKF